MKVKLALLNAKTKKIYSIGAFLIAIIISVISCTKDPDLFKPNKSSESANRMPTAFVSLDVSTSSQTFDISCTCYGGFTLNATTPALNYGTINSTTVTVTNSTYSAVLNKNVYYYVIPSGGSWGSSTKCLKVKFITGNVIPGFNYKPSANVWNGSFQTNSDIDVSVVAKSSVPGCTPC